MFRSIGFSIGIIEVVIILVVLSTIGTAIWLLRKLR